MRTGISISVTTSDRARLEAIVAARSSPQKHVWRARIILLTDQGLGTNAIMAATAKSKTCVWRWQERFMAEGVEGLLRDKTRPPGIAPLDAELVDKVVTLTLAPPGHEATHWTVRAMAKAAGIAASSVVKIWHDHGLTPHRWRSFKLSNDKAFAEKLHDVVGLYVSPPAQAIVLSVDEKSQIQRPSTSSSTIMRPTSSPRPEPGWPDIRAGPSTSCRSRSPFARRLTRSAFRLGIFGHFHVSFLPNDRIASHWDSFDHVGPNLRTLVIPAFFCYQTAGPGNTSP